MCDAEGDVFQRAVAIGDSHAALFQECVQICDVDVSLIFDRGDRMRAEAFRRIHGQTVGICPFVDTFC